MVEEILTSQANKLNLRRKKKESHFRAKTLEAGLFSVGAKARSSSVRVRVHYLQNRHVSAATRS